MFDWDDKMEIEKVVFFDNFYQNINVETADSDALTSFLENIFKTSPDMFLKEQALYYLCELVIAKQITNPFKALALLFDIKPSDEEFLIIQSIRFLFLFYLQKQHMQEIHTIISKLQNHHSAEVASEAHFRLGLIELGNILPNPNTLDILQNIDNAKRLFTAATIEIENRIDADFFLHFVTLQSAVYQNDYKAFEVACADMKNIVWEKQIYSLENGDIELEFSIHQLIEHLKCTYESARRSNIWYYPLKELSVLNDSFLQLEKCSMVNCHYQDFHQQVKTGIVRNCLNTVYLSGLNNKIELVESIDTSIEVSISTDFINYVLNLLQSQDESILNDTQFVLALREILTNPRDIEEVLKQLGERRDISTVLNVLGDFTKRTKDGLSHFETGYIVSEDVLNTLRKQVSEKTPNLDREKYNIFFNVLAEVIRYAQHSHLGYNKAKFAFLFSKKAGGLGEDTLESDLQNDLFESLKHTSIAQYFEYEKEKAANGGRVDIICRCDKMSIPIEVKKTKESPTIEKIEEYYIAQTQTYTSAYEQLGIFVLLDLSDKEKKPMLDFKDWFNLHHLPPATNLPVKHPDYVISIVIPGNKLLPSMMSTYK
jgi:hypothetical protein